VHALMGAVHSRPSTDVTRLSRVLNEPTLHLSFVLSLSYLSSSYHPMFGLFSRKQQPAAKVPNIQSDAMAVDSEPKQLRTPSPSEAAFNGLGPAANITLSSLGPSMPDTSKPALAPTPEVLHALVATIPPKTLHAYVLAHIPGCPPDTLAALASFFATLKPPPLLHCVRCHADYTDVENGDRSCHVPHDDESAEVEWVGRSRGDCEYETFWFCCGKTVEGEGDLGPPDGWCYEGMHTVSRPGLSRSPHPPFSHSPPSFPSGNRSARIYTHIGDAPQTDAKRARFRADSTNTDDKLVSCYELNCRNIRARPKSTSASASGRAKRARPPPPSEDDVGHDYDDCRSVVTDDTGIAEIAHGVGELGQKRKGKGKANANANSKGKARAKPKSSAAAATSMPAQARVRVLMPGEPDSDAGSNKAGRSGAPVARAPSTRRRRRSDAKPRSAASSGSKAASPPSSPMPRGRKPPSVSKMDSVEIVLRSRSSTRSRVRGGGAETGDEKAMTDSEGKVRKRRRVAGPPTAA